MNENYSEYYERLKIHGVKPAISFVDKIDYNEEFIPITDNQVKDIQENRYLVSNYGRIYDSKREKFISQKPDKDGYMTCSLICNNGYSKRKVHRVELSSFQYKEDFENYQVNHKDGIHDNNMISNLEWVTAKENSDHAMLFSLHNMNGENNPNSKLSENDVNQICKMIESGDYLDIDIARKFNVSCTTICDIHKRKIWRHISRKYNF